MAKSRYPYQAFTVSPAMVVKEVTVVGPSPRVWQSSWEQTATGKVLSRNDLHKTRSEAIAVGEAQCLNQEERLKVAQANLAKRRANLTKAKEAA